MGSLAGYYPRVHLGRQRARGEWPLWTIAHARALPLAGYEFSPFGGNLDQIVTTAWTGSTPTTAMLSSQWLHLGSTTPYAPSAGIRAETGRMGLGKT